MTWLLSISRRGYIHNDDDVPQLVGCKLSHKLGHAYRSRCWLVYVHHKRIVQHISPDLSFLFIFSLKAKPVNGAILSKNPNLISQSDYYYTKPVVRDSLNKEPYP